MSEAAHYAFALAYKWWLHCDAHYSAALRGKPKVLDGKWVRDIGQSYQVNRTIPEDQEDAFARLVMHSGQGQDMDIEQRAARVSLALKNRLVESFADSPSSALTKISWFVWPSNWTILDRYVVKAVIGSPSGTALDRLERFYAALAMRGWDDHLALVRDALRPGNFPLILAERVIDKYLFLASMDDLSRVTSTINGFMAALPDDLRERIDTMGDAIAPILESGALLHRTTPTDRKNLKERAEALRHFKKSIAA